jgi:hypothetical protein
MGIVYEAFDRERSTRVALKTLQHYDVPALYRFKQEFRSLADVTHPNLIALYELLNEGDSWFFTMEFVEGMNFLEYLFHRSPAAASEVSSSSSSRTAAMTQTATSASWSPGDHDEAGPIHVETPADIERLRAALPQLAAALNAVHATGKLHRDIKPSNVMVTPEGRVVVLDFGLTFDMQQSLDRMGSTAGTIDYMSPEQARGARLTPASDWFSVGVMLHKSLTGRLPSGGSSGQVHASKQTWRPDPPSMMVQGVPADLDRLCMDLLALEPEDRPSGAEVLRRVAPDADAAGPVIAPSAAAQDAIFVGRAAELEGLREAFEELREGKTGLVLVHGTSGAGKTALVRHFLNEIQGLPDTLVLSGRCYEQESVPYKAFDTVIDELGRHLRKLGPVERAKVSPRNAQAVAQIFPALSDLEGFGLPAKTASQDLSDLRRRAFGGCREMLARIGDFQRLVISIDDLQWADSDSALLLAEILRPPDSPAVLLLGTFRSNELPEAVRAAVGVLPSRREIALPPLSQDEARELAAQLLGDGSERAAVIARESGGHAYFIHELAQAGGVGAGEGRLDNVIWRRVSALPEPSRRLLEAIAISGKPITQEDAYAAAGLEELAPATLAPLRIGALVRGSGPNRLDIVEPYHDRIRESVAAHLPGSVQAQIHGELARVLEASGRADADTLATHFDHAGRPHEARRYYILAAEHASQSVAFDRAVTLYRRAIELADAGDTGLWALRNRLADALANAGRGPEAARLYQELAATADPATALKLRQKAASQFCSCGHLDEGGAVLSEVLKQVGLWEPSGPAGAVAGLIANRTLLGLRGLRFTERDPAQIPAELLARVDAARAAATSVSVSNLIKGVYFNCRSVLLALRAGDPIRVAACLAWEAPIQALGGFHAERKGRRLIAAARAILEKHPDPRLKGFIALAEGAVEHLVGNWQQSAERMFEAERLLTEHGAGMVWELATTRLFLVLNLRYLGSYRDLGGWLRPLVQDAYERGDIFGAANLTNWGLSSAHVVEGNPAAARMSIDKAMALWERTGYHEQHLIACLARGEVDLYEGKPFDAWKRMEREWPLMRRNMLLMSNSNRMHVTDLRGRAALRCAALSNDRNAHLQSAARDAAWLEKQAQGAGKGMGAAIRGGILTMRGDQASARACFERSLEFFERFHMKAHCAAVRRRLGGAENERAAREWAESEGIREPERMAEILVPDLI